LVAPVVAVVMWSFESLPAVPLSPLFQFGTRGSKVKV
jgi:hypothetical protein